MNKDAIHSSDNMLILDDLLATGGTAKAVGELVTQLKDKIEYFAFLINLIELKVLIC